MVEEVDFLLTNQVYAQTSCSSDAWMHQNIHADEHKQVYETTNVNEFNDELWEISMEKFFPTQSNQKNIEVS